MVQQIQIIEKKPVGYIIKHVSTNIIQFISELEFQKRIDWGIYEIIHGATEQVSPKTATSL